MGRRERKVEKRKQVVMASILVFLMVVSMFGVIVGNQDPAMSYNDYDFEQRDNRFYTEINDEQLMFYTMPQQVEHFNLSDSIPNKLREAYLVMVSFDPSEESELQYIDAVRFDISTYLGKAVLSGVTQESEAYELPVINCNNASVQTPVIMFNISSDLGITEQDNCIFINGAKADLLRLRDRLLYAYFGIIEN